MEEALVQVGHDVPVAVEAVEEVAAAVDMGVAEVDTEAVVAMEVVEVVVEATELSDSKQIGFDLSLKKQRVSQEAGKFWKVDPKKSGILESQKLITYF